MVSLPPSSVVPRSSCPANTCQKSGASNRDDAETPISTIWRNFRSAWICLYAIGTTLPKPCPLARYFCQYCWTTRMAYLMPTIGRQGFMRGVEMRNEAWRKLFDDEEHRGPLLPILVLFHEHDPDPEMRPSKEPIDAEWREKLIVGAAVAVRMIYEYFAAHRRMAATTHDKAEPRRRQSKVGRNDPCPCGSGKKYKRCCGQASIH